MIALFFFYSKGDELQVILVLIVLLLLQVSVDALVAFLDDFNQHIFEMVTSNDINEKKGGIYAISKCFTLIGLRKRLKHMDIAKECNQL